MTDISPIMIGSPETGLYKRQLRPLSIFDRSLIVPAIWASFRKLDPRTLVKNPVMFCVEIVSVLTTIFFLRDLIAGAGTVVGTNALFSGQITVWLWFTVLFANFAEAVARRRPTRCAAPGPRPRPSVCRPPTRATSSWLMPPPLRPVILCWSNRMI